MKYGVTAAAPHPRHTGTLHRSVSTFCLLNIVMSFPVPQAGAYPSATASSQVFSEFFRIPVHRMDISEDLAPERLLVPEQTSQTAAAVTMAM